MNTPEDDITTRLGPLVEATTVRTRWGLTLPACWTWTPLAPITVQLTVEHHRGYTMILFGRFRLLASLSGTTQDPYDLMRPETRADLRDRLGQRVLRVRYTPHTWPGDPDQRTPGSTLVVFTAIGPPIRILNGSMVAMPLCRHPETCMGPRCDSTTTRNLIIKEATQALEAGGRR
ncbi:MAG: hypothetical protein ACRDRO_03985 [Pseudonocardiaceae bacterium]